MDADQAAPALQSVQLLEQAARRNSAECAQRRRARVFRSSENAPARGKTCGVGRLGGRHACSRETGQVGRQREGVDKLELRDEGLRGSHRPGAVGGRDGCRGRRGRVEQRKRDASQAVLECAVVCRLDHVVLAEPWIASPMLRMLFQAYSPTEQCNDAGGVGVFRWTRTVR